MVTTNDELYTEDTEIPKAMEEVKSDRHPQTRIRLHYQRATDQSHCCVTHTSCSNVLS